MLTTRQFNERGRPYLEFNVVLVSEHVHFLGSVVHQRQVGDELFLVLDELAELDQDHEHAHGEVSHFLVPC